MITGVHALVFSPEAEQLRAFFRDQLGLQPVDAGGGWLIFTLPPAELAAHPDSDGTRHELYFMCDDLDATMQELSSRGVEFTGPPRDERFGRVTAMRIPGGAELALYQPRHATATG